MLECVGKKKQTLSMHLKLRAYKLLGNIKLVRKILLGAYCRFIRKHALILSIHASKIYVS